MQAMGLMLFLWIVVAPCLGLFLIDRASPRATTRRVEAEPDRSLRAESTL